MSNPDPSRQNQLETLKRIILDHRLPRADFALFAVACPYCGKADRIRKLEPPGDLDGEIPPEAAGTYGDLWRSLASLETSLGICGFCRNILRLHPRGGRAEGVYE